MGHKELVKDIFYIGVNDHDIDLFEGQFDVTENGMAYNSYVIVDEKIAVMDSVGGSFSSEWLANLEDVLNGRSPDFLIVQHMEPDHSANIDKFMAKYPEATLVTSKLAANMVSNYFGTNYPERQLIVKGADTLELGSHTLSFIAAANVHWPEVIMTYDSFAKCLFSADGFGKFGALDVDEEWACEARRYYFGIVGKFGPSVQAVLKRAAALDIEIICPLHGPVLDENLDYYLDLYNTWSSYGVESEGVTIAYTSVYGHTKEAAELLAQKLEEGGCPKVAISDLAREDQAEVVEDAFRYGTLVCATTTYNGDFFPIMHEFIHHLTDKNYQARRVAFIENGSWGPMAAKKMRAIFEGLKDITFAENTVTVRGAINDSSRAQIDALAKELLA